MEEKIQSIKENYHISKIFPIAPITLQKEKVYLFFSRQQEVAYSLYTDGNIEHIDTWIDKKPYDRDSFLKECSFIKRFEFQITNANVLLVEKKYQNRTIRNLYLDQDNLYKIINNKLYQISISSSEKIMIKRIGELS